MNKRPADVTTATATETRPEPASTDVLSGIEFTTPMLRLAKNILGPFLRHGDACTADACACGLSQAVAELERREMITQRYGSVDA
jgi:hypothetical protein